MPSKNTQWAKCDDFTDGAAMPNEGEGIKLTTTFLKDALTRQTARHSHLEKLLRCDNRLRNLIERNPKTQID